MFRLIVRPFQTENESFRRDLTSAGVPAPPVPGGFAAPTKKHIVKKRPGASLLNPFDKKYSPIHFSA
jgi:hypothetical protein